jgi:hypothetical protein
MTELETLQERLDELGAEETGLWEALTEAQHQLDLWYGQQWTKMQEILSKMSVLIDNNNTKE